MNNIRTPVRDASQDFAIRNLSVLAYAQGFTLWHYRGRANTVADMTSAGFFNPSSDMLAEGDMILLTARDGGAVVFVSSSSDVTGVKLARLAP